MSSKLSCFSFRTSLLTMRCLSQSNLRRAGCAGPNPGRPSPVPLAKPFYSRMHAPSTSNNTVGSITRICSAAAAEAAPAGASRPVKPEQDVKGMTQFLDSLKFDKNGLVAVIVQVGRQGGHPHLGCMQQGCLASAERAVTCMRRCSVTNQPM